MYQNQVAALVANVGGWVQEDNVFLKLGKIWLVRYGGGNFYLFPHQVGFSYIRFYLRNPGCRYDVKDLAIHKGFVALPAECIPVPDAQDLHSDTLCETTDAQSLQQYGPRIVELETKLRDEETGRISLTADAREKLRRELDFLQEHVGRTSYKGKPKLTSGVSKKKQDKITGALRRALAVIRDEIPPLGDHFDAQLDTRIRGGYSNNQPTCWKTCPEDLSIDDSSAYTTPKVVGTKNPNVITRKAAAR
jgi:hypothetical protein